MSTQTKQGKVMLRQTVSCTQTPTREPVPQVEPAPGDATAQYEDSFGDRVLYLIWLGGAGLLMLHVFLDTLLGQLF